MNESLFGYKSPNFQKLTRFGFVKNGGAYTYSTTILDGQFEMRVEIAASGKARTEVVDSGTGEPYTLHLVAEAGGAFVGSVREEYERVIAEIAQACFERDVFQSKIAHTVIEYVRKTYGDELEFLWDDSPTSAIWRRKDNRKWYGILLMPSKRKLGLDSDEKIDIIDVRVDPDVLAKIADGKKYFHGYHMNKKKWMTLMLDGSVSAEEVCDWLDKSYVLAKK